MALTFAVDYPSLRSALADRGSRVLVAFIALVALCGGGLFVAGQSADASMSAAPAAAAAVAAPARRLSDADMAAFNKAELAHYLRGKESVFDCASNQHAQEIGDLAFCPDFTAETLLSPDGTWSVKNGVNVK